MNVFDFGCGLAVGFLLSFVCYLVMFLFMVSVEGAGESEEKD